MKPYSDTRNTKGLAGCRRSKDTPHRRRCLRVDKKAARRVGKTFEFDEYRVGRMFEFDEYEDRENWCI